MNQYQFGTIFGSHTVAELIDLVTAKDVAMRNLARRFEEVKDKPFDFTSFSNAYVALVQRYNAARKVAQKAINDATNALRPDSMISADNEYNGLLSALNPRWKEYTWSPGDGSLDDLYDQIINKFGSTGVNDEPTPQPGQASDFDFNVLTAATQATHAIESAASTTAHLFDTKHLIAYGLIGGVFALFVLPKLMAVGMGPATLIRHRG